MTTTSTTNFVNVEGDDDSLYSSWSTLEAPAHFPPSASLNPSPQRRLRKRKPSHLCPVPPAEVLARNNYNHPTNPGFRRRLRSEPSSTSVTLGAARSISQKFVNHLEKLRNPNGSLDEGWVCVDVTQKITQRVIKKDKD